MRHGSLFSGIGGFDLASEWMGWENVFQVEIDDYCQKVLAKNFPNVSRYGDIKDFKGQVRSVDILTGGFPCQPFSTAGKRKGESDDRYLWPEYLRVIREIQPSYVVGENVAGLVSMEDGGTLDGILSDLEGEGYQTEQFIIPACGVGAWHRRDRVWIIAHNEKFGRGSGAAPEKCNRTQIKNRGLCRDVSNTKRIRRRQVESSEQGRTGGERPTGEVKHICSPGRGTGWESEPNVGRVANGIPKRVDRLKGLGNAIVPQVAYEIFRAIDGIS